MSGGPYFCGCRYAYDEKDVVVLVKELEDSPIKWSVMVTVRAELFKVFFYFMEVSTFERIYFLAAKMCVMKSLEWVWSSTCVTGRSLVSI